MRPERIGFLSIFSIIDVVMTRETRTEVFHDLRTEIFSLKIPEVTIFESVF